MDRISVRKIQRLHNMAIDSGSNESEQILRDLIRDEGTLFYIVNKACMISDDMKCAASLLHSIATLHPFVEGNKRTAVLAAEFVMLDKIIDVDGKELDAFIRNVASGIVKEKDVFEWLRSNCKSIKC
ncbi:MAG: Fic family protein [Candidatus Methanoplasma sp.]|jgi:death-on-curing family protein|nr:Fic family protein [Candidatus Methanoplasma sp.]